MSKLIWCCITAGTLLTISYQANSHTMSVNEANQAVEQRIEIEKQQEAVVNLKDYVSDERGARKNLLSAPIKTDDAPTNVELNNEQE
ncbi:hypothetical protein [Vibrio porteresiae]|uniref:Cell division protein FtsL n=1 Tax=Vibrio porteresiae DSM 19223 TaxID=1123496 RepID=A0ABZ0QJ61_9VIBR|nr:hypothetical protein [Vibrio porteresiae]WPC76544.1 hypothetical protein R8Z52_18620 [Vibrio porteresiae DSM 19223]